MKRLLASVLMLLALPAVVSAQFPSQNISLPAFVIPASAVSGGGSFPAQLFGPLNCSTAPAYSFTGLPTYGFGLTGTAPCVVVNGTSVMNWSSTAVTSGVPIQINNSSGFISLYAADGSSGPSNVTGLRAQAGSNGFFFETAANNNWPFIQGFSNINTRTWNGSSYTDVLTVNGGSAAGQSINLGPNDGVPLMFVSAPTVTSAGTSPSVVANGTAAFRVNVGTGGTATTIVMAMPAATTGWNCVAQNITGNAANRANQHVVMQSSTTTSITVQNQTISTGAALAFTASDIVAFVCTAY